MVEVINTRYEGPVAIVAINNPPADAISAELRRALIAEVDAIDAKPEVATVVWTGAGGTFVAGADVEEFDEPPKPPHLPDVVSWPDRPDRHAPRCSA